VEFSQGATLKFYKIV